MLETRSIPQQFIQMKLGEVQQQERFVDPYSKIISPENARKDIALWQAQGNVVVMLDGVFDLPHYAHAEYLLACANLGDKLVVRINSDGFVAERKDPRGPILSWVERAKHTAHYSYVDRITLKDEGGWGWLSYYNPDILVKSITSGPAVRDEVQELNGETRFPGRIVLMDEYINIIPFEEGYERSKAYDECKYTHERISGSIIKKRIIDRLGRNSDE